MEEKCCRGAGKKAIGREWQGDPLPRSESISPELRIEKRLRADRLGSRTRPRRGSATRERRGHPPRLQSAPRSLCPAPAGPAGAFGIGRWLAAPCCPPALAAIHIYRYIGIYIEREIYTYVRACVCIKIYKVYIKRHKIHVNINTFVKMYLYTCLFI